MTAPRAKGRVLPTMNEDGSRRWVRPKPSDGAWLRRRQVVAYVLMVVYLAIPHIQMNGKPLMLLDAPRREFTLFGYTFLPTDTLLFMMLLGILVLLVFSFTAMFGRVWCGWGCPQTVWMEFLFRPLERWFEGGRTGSVRMDRPGSGIQPRRVAKFVVYFVISLILAHTFLAYFVGVDALREWVTRSPREHPSSFAIMAVTTTLVFLNFSYFREQTCTIACPYGRWQSVLLDKSSLIVAYDAARGEPRKKGSDRTGAGDCIDCGACVTTCPTGIDIRDGLQMECIHCTQCIDACDHIMRSVDKPIGLIRYSSREVLAGDRAHILRPRTLIYPAALALLVSLFVWQISTKDSADITLLRPSGAPFTEDASGSIVNQIRIKIANRTPTDQRYTIAIQGLQPSQLIIPINPFPVAKGHTAETSMFVVLPASEFSNGLRAITINISDGADFAASLPHQLLGPSTAGQRTP